VLSTGLFFPKPDPTYHINPDMEELMEHVNVVRAITPQNVGLVGPHGCGKTEWAIQFAARYKLGCLIMDAANIREPRDWFGYRDYDGSRIIWRRSLFDRAISEGNVVVVLDELPRAVSSVLNTLFPILDARRFTYLEEKGEVIRVGNGTVFVATMNDGMQYTGNNTLDAALRDRFPRRVEVNYLPPGDESEVLIRRTGISEDDAMKLTDLALTVRQKASGFGASLTQTLSTRQLLAAAHEFKSLGVKGLRYTIINHFSSEGGDTSERAQVLQMVQGKFGTV
jgi:MoxR-like ATPase